MSGKISGKSVNDMFLEDIGVIVFGKRILTNDEISFINNAMEKCSLDNLFSYVHSYFQSVYFNEIPSIQISHKEGIRFDIGCVNSQTPKIYIDDLLPIALLQSLTAIFLWDEYHGEEDIVTTSLHFITLSITEQYKQGSVPTDSVTAKWYSYIQKDEHILELAVDAYYQILTFVIAHEFAHLYLNHTHKYSCEDDGIKQELEADAVAYDCVLNLISAQSKNEGSLTWDRYYEHAYLASLMYFDYIELVQFTLRVCENKDIKSTSDASLKLRRDKLLEQVGQPRYQLNTEEGNIMYRCFLDVCDEYKSRLIQERYREQLIYDIKSSVSSPVTLYTTEDIISKYLLISPVDYGEKEALHLFFDKNSIKVENIVRATLDLKKLIMDVTRLLPAIMQPTLELGLIHVGAALISIVGSHMIIKLSDDAFVIMLMFHLNDIYFPEIDDIELCSFVQLELEKHHLPFMSEEKIRTECKNLYDLGCLGKSVNTWYLKEKVVYYDKIRLQSKSD